jgi:hypothetical protein
MAKERKKRLSNLKIWVREKHLIMMSGSESKLKTTIRKWEIISNRIQIDSIESLRSRITHFSLDFSEFETIIVKFYENH